MDTHCRSAALASRAVLSAFTASVAVASHVSATAAGSTKLRIGGTSMALGAMGQIGDAYAAVHPGDVIEVVVSLGTSGGLSAVAAGAIDLALAARP